MNTYRGILEYLTNVILNLNNTCYLTHQYCEKKKMNKFLAGYIIDGYPKMVTYIKKTVLLCLLFYHLLVTYR